MSVREVQVLQGDGALDLLFGALLGPPALLAPLEVVAAVDVAGGLEDVRHDHEVDADLAPEGLAVLDLGQAEEARDQGVRVGHEVLVVVFEDRAEFVELRTGDGL